VTFKKLAGMLLFILCLAFTPVVQADKAVVTTDDLTIRSGPGTDYQPTGQVHTGEMLQIISRKDGWLEIKLNNGSGWVTGEFVNIHSELNEDSTKRDKTTDSASSSITIQYDNTHLREGPSTSYDITGYAKKGDEFNVTSAEDNWYEIANEEMSGYVLKDFVDRHAPTSSGLEDKTIVIDAGHGGRDVGAIGASGTYEKDFTYQTMQELKKEMAILGARVVLTREADQFVFLSSRTSLSNLAETNAFISIHYNSFPQAPDVNGIGTYYYHKRGEELARLVQEGLIRKTGANDRDVFKGDYQVLRQNDHPAILVELGFISNHEKEQLLQTNSYQKQLVSGIVAGLTQYFK